MSNNPFKTLWMPVLLATAAWPLAASGPTLSVLYNGTFPASGGTGLLEGAPGLFYLSSAYYTVYSVDLHGTVTILASFKNPPFNIDSNPGVLAADGLLYSSVDQVTSANVFSVGSTPGSEKIYAKQSVTPELAGSLPDGDLFALALSTTAPSALATVDLRGVVTSLYQFATTDRPDPPTYGADGNYYGVSGQAISGATSYFYRVTPSGTFTNIAPLPFVSGGLWYGDGVLLQGTDGNFYGIQQTGLGCSSSNQHGAVYKLTLSGQFTILHDFGVCGKAIINSLIEGSDGKLYGIIQDTNEIFSVTKSGTYKPVAALNGTYGICTCGLMQGSDGNIYGSAFSGGSTGYGTVFALNAGLPVPKPSAREFYPASGPVGTQVRIWGYNLFGASAKFNGVAATNVRNAGPNYVWATVPTGATSGPITVTTPGGTSITKQSFTVQ